MRHHESPVAMTLAGMNMAAATASIQRHNNWCVRVCKQPQCSVGGMPVVSVGPRRQRRAELWTPQPPQDVLVWPPWDGVQPDKALPGPTCGSTSLETTPSLGSPLGRPTQHPTPPYTTTPPNPTIPQQTSRPPSSREHIKEAEDSNSQKC
ncbi:unnamed protein product [Arctogadus glacialis]